MNALNTRRYTELAERLGYFVSNMARHDLIENVSSYIAWKIKLTKLEISIKTIELEKLNKEQQERIQKEQVISEEYIKTLNEK